MLTSTVAILHDNTAHGEDNYLVRTLSHDACLDAVMDGVTGRGGREASQEVVNTLATTPPTSPEALVTVLEEINSRLYHVSLGRFLLTTASVALFLDGVLHVVSVGDSPVLLVRPHAVQCLSSQARGFLHAGPARALGLRKTLRQLCRVEVAIEPDDRVALLTDGITDNVTPDELATIFRCALSPDEAVEQLRMLLASRRAGGLLPAQLGGRFRNDDQTAICRFFSAMT